MASTPTNTPLREQAKAIVGAVLAGLTSLGYALSDGHVSPVEAVGIGIAFVASYGVVFGVSNKP